MPKYKRLPRKTKKKLKKDKMKWEEHVERRQKEKERQRSLDVVFTRNYGHSRKLVRRVIRTGKMK